MAALKIVSTGPLPAWASHELGPRFQLSASDSPQPEAIRGLLDESTAGIIARSSTKVNAELMEAAPNLRVIGRTGVGYDSIDVRQATRRGIPVLYTPDALTRPTAEHAVALILAAAKNVRMWHELVRQGQWQERNRTLNLDLHGAVLGIVGFGRIGREVRRLLRPFRMTVLACDPHLEPSFLREHEVEPVPLDELLRRSDIITLHTPLTSQTRHLIHRGNLGTCRPGAILVNAARGGLVESNAILLEALESGRLAAVALDTLQQEPPDPADPLLGHPRALVTAHVGSRTRAAQEEIVRTLLADLKAVLEGQEPTVGNVVNPEVFTRRRRGRREGRGEGAE